MNTTAIVILNYLVYEETIKCVNSVLNNLTVAGIVIVDNGSNNDSYKILSEKFKKNHLIKVIRAKKNYGFAKGNNIGIHYAKKNFAADAILLLNSDVIVIEKNYLDKLWEQYDESVGIIGSSVILPGNKIQNIYMVDLSLVNLAYDCFYRLFTYYNWEIFSNNCIKQKCKKKVIHGCVILLTPEFFTKYSGLYPGTFLYGEETILTIMLEKSNLRAGFAKDATIFHNGKQTTKVVFTDYSRQRQKYEMQSSWHILLTKILPYRILKKLI